MRNQNEDQRQCSRAKFRRSAKGTTCTNCRQQKLKCDSANTDPEPCSRCRQIGQHCVVNPAFRRRGNREYIQSLEEELQALRGVQSGDPSTNDSSIFDHVAGQTVFSRSPPTGQPSRFEHVRDQSLDRIHLSALTVFCLIEKYFTKYHPHLPILPDMELFVAEYDSSKLLLWTILAIASRDECDQPTLFSALVDPVRKMAADIHAPQSRSFRSMQALLLLCAWPFPFQQTINDPSPLYCSLATHVGYQLGLHRPFHRADFDERATGQTTSTSVELKTWYGCFIINQGLAMRLGVPTGLTPGRAISSAVSSSKPSDIPTSLLFELELSLMSYQWLKVLGDDESSTSGQCVSPDHLLIGFESQCANFREKHPGAWSQRHQVMFHGMQLQAYSFSINRQFSRDTYAPNGTTVADITIAKALSAVVQLISEVSKAGDSKGYWPVFSKYTVMNAACIGVFIAATTSERTARLTLLDACKEAISTIAAWSIFSKDSYARIGRHIATAIRRAESHGPTELYGNSHDTHKSPIISRMAANISYRVIWESKHGKSLDSSTEPSQGISIPVEKSLANHLSLKQGVMSVPNLSQPFELAFNDLNEIALFDETNDADFTDMLLDWESMRGTIPEFA